MRIYQVDALRGFALFGILIVNIFVFHAPYAHYEAFYTQFGGIDKWVVDHVIFLFAGKFMFLYAFLFGYSFWIQYEKVDEQKTFATYWIRRMLLLVLFGILHILLLSFGDILLPYAILGLSLPFFVKLSNTKLYVWLVLIYLIPLYEFILRGVIDYPSISIQPVTSLEDYIQINSQGSFYDIFLLRIQDYFSFRNEKLIRYVPKELALFLLGIICARAKMATHIDIKKGGLYSAVALVFVVGMYLFRSDIIGLFDYENSILQRSILGIILHTADFIQGLLYIILFFMIWRIGFVQKVLLLLSYPGRLSLTNYIMQSFICLVIFSGFGYYGQLSPSQLAVTAIGIYTAQLLFSILWLRYYKYGPLEYAWRKYSRSN